MGGVMNSKKLRLFIIGITLFILSSNFVLVSSYTNNVEDILYTTTAEKGWHLDKIKIDGAWALTNGSSDIVVAVIDSGINFAHPEITHCQWINEDEIAGNAIDDDLNGYTDDTHGWDFVTDGGNLPDNEPGPEAGDAIHWHASFITGVIAGLGDGSGIVGVAPNVSVMDVRVLKENNYAGTTNEVLGDAIRYAVDNGADVISMSLQYYANSSDWFDDIVYAYNNGVVIVSCTGNTWQPSGGQYTCSYPGCFDEAISVGATNFDDAKADYSNYGPWTELVAPVGDESDTYSRLIRSIGGDGFSYYTGWGTSFACPQVSAAVALMLTVNSSLTISDIRDILHDTATDLGTAGKDDYFGYGMLNVEGAVIEAIERGSYNPVTETPTPTLTPTPTETSPGFGIILSSIGMSITIAIITIRKKTKNKR
ncbi:MAG: S8 family serine peptidase [Asgard group archaeon]|nr:S8 family serine peptidase [Asgard group archaeon]